ncbi:hypothetical protein [Streptomyces sp. LaBMicrA B280]|uniref:hypothetical protein n=1 Tax=Streptomyces sp. LaBMicrA B280 TaxID=3391001 RepID=UPI003BA5FF03
MWTIYLTRFGGLSASESTVGATAGGALAAFLGVRNFRTFLPVALVANACDTARAGVFQVYVMGLAGHRERVAELGERHPWARCPPAASSSWRTSGKSASGQYES